MKEWRDEGMNFMVGLLVRYIIFMAAIFLNGGIMSYFFDGNGGVKE